MRTRASRPHAADVIGVLDLGTAKVSCLIVVRDTAGSLDLMGFGYQRSRGIKAGTVVDPDEAERAVRAAVAQAERMAGVDLERVTLAVGCGRIRSDTFQARVSLETGAASDHDISRLMSGARSYVERGGRHVVQLSRSDWHLDGAPGVRDPRGMAGRDLAVALTAVTADDAPLRNLLNVVERCHLDVARLVATPYASGLAAASDEERQAGVLVVDFGAGLTTLAGFAELRLVAVDVLPVGGNHVTWDLARVLVASVADAERIKTLYGTLVKAASDASEAVSYTVAGEDEPTHFQTSKAAVREIIEPRIDGLLDLVGERLAARGLRELTSGSVVLTGGAAQLIGLDQAWGRRFGGRARIGRPRPVGRMPASTCGPAFSTVIGLAFAHSSEAGSPFDAGVVTGGGTYLGRMQQWLRESF